MMLEAIKSALNSGNLIPYLGAEVLSLVGEDAPLPASPETLVARLTATTSVPHKIRGNLTAAAQFIENFKHRKSLSALMKAAFDPVVEPTFLHRYFAGIPNLPLLVHVWYDDLPQQALAARSNWGIVQGVSQAEHFGEWVNYFQPDGTPVAIPVNPTPGTSAQGTPPEALAWSTLLYQPLGSIRPSANFIVSDSDYVEVLTEIDIQTPIPEVVQSIRKGRNFLFLGCRFRNQLERSFARQIMKRSSDKHWAVMSDEPSKNERRFLEEQNIQAIHMPLADFAAQLVKDAPAINAAE